MKRSLFILISLMAYLCGYAGDYFNNVQCTLYATQPEYSKEDPKELEPRRRTPIAPLLCTITKESGVEFISGTSPEILFYQIEEGEETILETSEESTFVDALFSLSGELTIVIATPQWNYVGEVYIYN